MGRRGGGKRLGWGWGGGPAETSIKDSFTSANQLIPSELDANNTPQQTSRDRSTSRRTPVWNIPRSNSWCCHDGGGKAPLSWLCKRHWNLAWIQRAQFCLQIIAFCSNLHSVPAFLESGLYLYVMPRGCNTHSSTVPFLLASCRCGLWLQGSAAAAGHFSGLRDQVCLYRKDQRPSGRGDGYLQRRCESQKKPVTPKVSSLGHTARSLSAVSLSLQRSLPCTLNDIQAAISMIFFPLLAP